MPNSQELVEYIAKNMVNDPDAVAVHKIDGATTTIYELRVAPGDKGRVIGRQGQVANAMRTLLHVTAAKEGKRITLEIV